MPSSRLISILTCCYIVLWLSLVAYMSILVGGSTVPAPCFPGAVGCSLVFVTCMVCVKWSLVKLVGSMLVIVHDSFSF